MAVFRYFQISFFILGDLRIRRCRMFAEPFRRNRRLFQNRLLSNNG